MNKFKSLVLAAIGLLCSISVSAEDFEVDGIYYKITSDSDKTVAVTWKGTYCYSEVEYSGAVIIPETVTYSGITYNVTSIGDYAFDGCSSLTSVVIPNSVTSIGDYAFDGCSSLTFVEIPNSVTTIGGCAFGGCSSLTSVVIPNSVTSIGDGVFAACSSLTSVVIPNSVTSIGNGAFYSCSSLTSVEIPNSVTSIGYETFYGCSNLRVVLNNSNLTFTKGSSSYGYIAYYANVVCNGYEQVDDFIFTEEDHANYLRAYIGNATELVLPTNYNGYNYGIGSSAFGGCSSLTSVEIPNSVTSIGDYAFDRCSSLTSVEIPNSVTRIGNGAFYSCSSLTSVEIPNSVTSIGGWTFSYCSSLTSVEIPNSVTSIGNETFYDCSSLTSVVIGNSVTSIGESAFQRCSSLTSVEIPNSVTSIEGAAFSGCSGLTSVEIPNSVTSIGGWTFSYCSSLTSVVIPNSVTCIAWGLFQGCSSLTSVVIPNSVTSIEGAAFEDCNNLKSITSLNPTPPATDYWNSPFANHEATLYVPFGAKTAYSEANNWKNFTNIEELVYELTDGEEYNEASNKTVNTLVYTRTLPNLHWNALYVPFELPYDVVAEHYDVAYINDVNGYDTDDNGEIDDLAMEIIKIKSGTLKANYPYLIKAKTEADKAMSITVEDATLYAAEENSVDCSSVYQNYVVKGTYTKKTAEELVGKLAISTSGAWQPLAEGTALNPFRLYLSIDNRDNSPLKVEASAMSRMRIVEGGETTGIEDVVPSQQREDVIFDLSGRRVKQPMKGGVYIVNGKKRIL